MVAVSSGQFCTEESFTDVSGYARHDCVKDNFHVYCGNGAPLTLYTEDHVFQIGDLVFVSGFWFALKCGSLAILLDATPSLSCPPPPCGNHSCVFVNPGGIEPQSLCTGGNTVKSCPDGNLFIGNDEYKNAACSTNGKWVAWTCDGEMEEIEGALSATCSRTHCSVPVLLTNSQLKPDVIVDTTQMITNEQKFSCKEGSVIGQNEEDGFYRYSPSAFVQCNLADNKWTIVVAESVYEETGLGIGCVKPSCPSSQFFNGTESELFSLASELVKTTPAMDWNWKFSVFCPSRSSLAYWNGSELVMATSISGITCTTEGWKGNTTSSNVPLGLFKYGCFAPKCPNSLTYMTQSQVSSIVGVIVDVNQKATFVNGAFQLKCSLDSQLATITGTTLTVQNWWLGCGESGWMVKEEGKADVAYTNVAVGCIKPTCKGMNLFDGTEALLATKPNYEFVDVQPSFANNKWALSCPSECLIGYAETSTFLVFDVTMKVTCDAAGWWVRSSANPTGYALPPKKIGCFKKLVPID